MATYTSVPLADTHAFRDSIEHVVVLVLENRSFDHLLGFLYDQAHMPTQVLYPAAADASTQSRSDPPFYGLDFPLSYSPEGAQVGIAVNM